MTVRQSRARPRARLDRGQALVEFAIVAPLLIVLVIGVFEVARAWQAYQVVTDAAREGARNAVVDNSLTEDSVKALVRNAITRAALDPARIDSLGIAGFKTGQGDPTEVFLSYDYEWIWLRPLLGWLVGDASLTLKSNIIMRQE